MTIHDNFVVINSKHRASGTSTNFIKNLGQTIEARAVVVKSVSIPNTSYNVNTHNNKLTITIGGTSTEVIIPVGQYSLATIMSAIQSQLRSELLDESLTVTEDALTHKLSIVSSTAFRISTDPIISPLAKVLGAGSDAGYYPASETSSFTLPDLPSLQGNKNYYLCSNTLAQGSNGIFKNGENLPLIMVVPCEVAFGFTEHYQATDETLTIKRYDRPQNIQSLDIKLYDEDLNIVDLNGQDVEIILKVYTSDSHDLLNHK
jgi:hypothetical protein